MGQAGAGWSTIVSSQRAKLRPLFAFRTPLVERLVGTQLVIVDSLYLSLGASTCFELVFILIVSLVFAFFLPYIIGDS